MSTSNSFFWHDYETFGRDPARDRPSQFAGIRTDFDFNIIGDPLMVYCKPPTDYLPDPEACLLTGIMPQHCLSQGLPEPEFIAQIHQQLAIPETCGVGYNTLRFDDEFTRHILYRNFHDPYAREWQQNNSRWDLIDLVRTCRALRPDGIEWPHHQDGRPSNKLEDLSQANGLAHEQAHDAMSDVYATIALAKLIKTQQPRLFDYALQLRRKNAVADKLNWQKGDILVHVSGMISGDFLNTSLIMPLAQHPINKNGVICWDLRFDPSLLAQLSADEINQYLYTPKSKRTEDTPYIALKTIHINKSPIVAPLTTLDHAAQQRCQIDLSQSQHHHQWLKLNLDEIRVTVEKAFSQTKQQSTTDPELMLYSGSFFSSNDKQLMDTIRSTPGNKLESLTLAFEDSRLEEMLFRYRARHFNDSLALDEKDRWLEHCRSWLLEEAPASARSLWEYQQILEEKAATAPEEKHPQLQKLYEWGEYIEQTLEESEDAF